MYIYNIICGAVTVSFFITSSLSAAPLTDTLRPIAASERAVFDLAQELSGQIPPASESITKLVIFDYGKVITPYDYHRAAKFLSELFGVGEDLAFRFFEERNTVKENPFYQYEHAQIDEEQLREALIGWIRKNSALKNISLSTEELEEILNSIWSRSFYEVVSLIKNLKEKGYKISILSTTNDIHHRYFMKNVSPLLGIGEDDVFASHLTKRPKPTMESYLQVVRYAGVSAENALFIDDRQDCVAGAIRAGLKARLFNPENPLGSVRDIAISLSKDGLASEGFDLYPETPVEFDDRIGFVMIKPDDQKHKNALIKEFTDAGIEIVSVITPKEPLEPETWRLFYEEHRGKDFFEPMIRQFDSGKVTLVILRGEKDAYKKIKEIIKRWDGSKEGALPLSRIHISDNPRTALREIGLTHKRDELSRIFKVSNIPQTKSIEEYLADFEKRFCFKPGDAAKMKSRFADYLKKALSGQPGEIRINKAHIGVPAGDEKGRYLRLEVGGTNVRVGLVELFGNHKYEIYPFELEREIPAQLKKGDGAGLFDFFAECVAEFIREYETKERAGQGYELTFIFSFGLAKTAINEAVIYEMTKEFRVTGVIGNNLKDLFHQALDRKGVKNVRTVACGNDTESLTAGAAYLFEHCLLCFILSTGYNIGLLTLGDIFNTEAGNWKDDIFLQGRSSFDIWLDLNSTQPIEYAAEKTLTGTYVGELVRVVLFDMISRGLLFNGQTSSFFYTPWAFKTKYLDGIQRHPETETAKIKEYIQTLGIEDVSDEDCRAVWRVADMVTTRAAQVVGAHLSAAIDNTDYDFTHALNMLAEGAFIEKSPVMQDKIKAVLTELYGPGASNVNMVVNRDATKVGAAVMGAIGKAKSSSAGESDLTYRFVPVEISPERLIKQEIAGKKMHAYITAKGTLSGEEKPLTDFASPEDLVPIIARAIRARSQNLTGPLTREEISYYMDNVTVWEGRGFTIKEDESDYYGAVGLISELAESYGTVKEAREYLESPDCKLWRAGQYNIALKTLYDFPDETPMKRLPELIESQCPKKAKTFLAGFAPGIKWNADKAKQRTLGAKIPERGYRTDYQEELLVFEDLAIEAADRLIQIRSENKGEIETSVKAVGGDTITSYDKPIQDSYIRKLHSRFPEWRFIAEEGVSPELQDDGKAEYLCMIDPIDGTDEFARRSDYSDSKFKPMFKHKEYGTGLILFRRVDGELKPLASVAVLPELDIDGRGFSIEEAVYDIEGVFLNGEKIMPSHTAVSDLKDRDVIVEPRRGQEPAVERIAREFGRAYTDVCSLSHFLFLALGKIAGKMSGCCCIWDTAIGGFIAEKAGKKLVYLADGTDVFPLDPRRWDEEFSTDNIFAGDKTVVSHILSVEGRVIRPYDIELLISQAA